MLTFSLFFCSTIAVSAFAGVGPAFVSNPSSLSTASSTHSAPRNHARIPYAGGASIVEAPSASSSSLAYRSGGTVEIEEPERQQQQQQKEELPTVTASGSAVTPERKIAITEAPDVAPPTPTPMYRRPKITTINSYEEYMDFLNEDDRLCVIKFHASWCKTCKKFGMQFKRIGKEIGDVVACYSDGTETLVKEGDIRLAQIEYGANTELCNRLGIKKLPSVHFYSQAEKVDGFACGPKKLKHMIGRLQYFRSLSLDELKFEAEMNKGSELLESSEMMDLQKAASSALPKDSTLPSVSASDNKPAAMI